MNWSGGYKHRFRPNTEIRKTPFQQQSRIILVDLVKHDALEQTSHNCKNDEQKSSTYSLKMETVLNDEIPVQQIGTPFHNIPCGSSSDSEESGNDELSSTNYSPFLLDQKSEQYIESNMSEKNQQNDPSSHMFDEYYEDSNSNEDVLAQQSPQSGFSLFVSNSSVECLTPPYLNQNPYFSSPSLSFLTPVIHRENTLGYSDTDGRVCQPRLDHNSNRNLPYSTSLPKKTVIQDNSIFNTPIQTDSRKALSTTNCSLFVPVDTSRAQRKQVHFYSSDQESTADHRVSNFYERNQVNFSSPNKEKGDNPCVNAARNKYTLSILPVGPCSTPVPYYVNQHFNYQTPNLGSSTTAIHHENLEGFSTNDQRISELKDSTANHLPYSTQINIHKRKPSVFQTTPIKSQVVHGNPDQANCSMFPASVDTPVQQKQVQFSSSVPFQKMKVCVSNTVVPIKEAPNLNTLMPSIFFTQGSSIDLLKCQTSTSPPNKEKPSVIFTEETISVQHESCKEKTSLVQFPSETRCQEITTNTNKNRNEQTNPKSTTRKRKQCAVPKRTARSLRKKFRGGYIQHCRCRSVIQKVKIRDAETQTSP